MAGAARHHTGSEPGHESIDAEHWPPQPFGKRTGVGHTIWSIPAGAPRYRGDRKPSASPRRSRSGAARASHWNAMLLQPRHTHTPPQATHWEITGMWSPSEILASKAVDTDTAV